MDRMNMLPRVLVIAGDTWHTEEIVGRGLAPLEAEGFSFSLTTSPRDVLTPQMLREFPAILCCKSNVISTGEPWFDEEICECLPADFRAYVEEGGNLLAIHAGCCFYPGETWAGPAWEKVNRDYYELTGCIFKGHPTRCPVTVHVEAPEHPIMRGVNDFTERDEHYQLELIADDAQLLFTTSSQTGGSGRPGGYVRQIGRGKVIVLTPGHILSVWLHPEFQKILRNALMWCV